MDYIVVYEHEEEQGSTREGQPLGNFSAPESALNSSYAAPL